MQEAIERTYHRQRQHPSGRARLLGLAEHWDRRAAGSGRRDLVVGIAGGLRIQDSRLAAHAHMAVGTRSFGRAGTEPGDRSRLAADGVAGRRIAADHIAADHSLGRHSLAEGGTAGRHTEGRWEEGSRLGRNRPDWGIRRRRSWT